MKKKIAFILCSLFILNATAQKRHGGLGIDNLKGKVKEIYDKNLSGRSKFGKLELNENNAEPGSKFVFNEKGLLIEWSRKDLKCIYVYNEKGKRSEEARFNENGVLDERAIWEYDEMGNLTKETNYNTENQITGMQTWEFDAKGNKIEEISYNKSGNLDKKVKYNYDSTGNKIEEITYDKNGKIVYGYDIKIKYDLHRNIMSKSVFDKSGTISGSTNFKYDLSGKKIEETNYDKNNKLLKKLGFDKAGNLIETYNTYEKRFSGQLIKIEKKEKYYYVAGKLVEYEKSDNFGIDVRVKYNDKGDVTEDSQFWFSDSSDNPTGETKRSYSVTRKNTYEYDDHQNWTKLTVEEADGYTVFVTERKIVYY